MLNEKKIGWVSYKEKFDMFYWECVNSEHTSYGEDENKFHITEFA